jgi:hypothetical protein
MYMLNYSLDNLSMMALILSIGFVVDDAIVMLENIVRHMEMGKSRMAAALEGGREIAFTVLSMTLSLTAVFIPIFFMNGILGRLFREFAVTIRDHGMGQAPANIHRTLLSLGRTDKADKPYLIGVFGQGGSSAFSIAKYSIVISRRAADIRNITAFTKKSVQ